MLVEHEHYYTICWFVPLGLGGATLGRLGAVLIPKSEANGNIIKKDRD
jgi:hypothetical protein